MGEDIPDDGMCGCTKFEEPEMSQVFNKAAYTTLLTQEVDYLTVNGWTSCGPEKWSNEVLGRDGLVHGHAVNVQKQRDRMSLRQVTPARQASQQAEEGIAPLHHTTE
jgi:hypothetical protein